MRKTFLFLSTLSIIQVSSGLSAQAKWGTFNMTDDNGDQVVVKHGLFGKKTIVKDRYGDGFEHSKSIFGLTKDTKVGVLGNEVHAHKGLFGFGKTEGHDMLGDTVSSNKNLLYRNTNVNLSGANTFLNKFLSPSKNQPSMPINPNLPRPADSMSRVSPNNSATQLADPNSFSDPKLPNNQNPSN